MRFNPYTPALVCALLLTVAGQLRRRFLLRIADVAAPGVWLVLKDRDPNKTGSPEVTLFPLRHLVKSEPAQVSEDL